MQRVVKRKKDETINKSLFSVICLGVSM